MKTKQDYFKYDTQEVTILVKEIHENDLQISEDQNFTREDNVDNNNEPNYFNKKNRRNSIRFKVTYDFVVVWQRYELSKI